MHKARKSSWNEKYLVVEKLVASIILINSKLLIKCLTVGWGLKQKCGKESSRKGLISSKQKVVKDGIEAGNCHSIFCEHQSEINWLCKEIKNSSRFTCS